MSGRVFQNIVLQFKDAVDTEIGVIDAEGTVIACTELSEIGSHWSELVSSINDGGERGSARRQDLQDAVRLERPL